MTASVPTRWCHRLRPALGLPAYTNGEQVVGHNGRAHLRGGVAVTANDMIVVDRTGCVRVPSARADAVLEASRRYIAAEELVAKALVGGEPLARAYCHKKPIVDELRR